MLIVPVEEARPGMRLAASVLSPVNPDQELLKRGYVLDQAIIGRLREMQVLELGVDYPGLEDLDRELAPHLSPERLRLCSQVRRTIEAVEHTAQPTVAFTDYYESIRGLVLTLLTQGDHPVYLDLMAAHLGPSAVRHGAAVAHLALVLGIRLRRYLVRERWRLEPGHASEVVNLGVAGMLHDLGKSRLPEPCRAFDDLHPPRDQEERRVWEQHPWLGYQMLRGGVEPSAAAAVLHHHQHFDGSGFPTLRTREGRPRQLEGTHIHVYARILHAADLFDHLAHTRQGPRPNWQVLRQLSGHLTGRVDPVVLEALQAAVPPYPPGTQVVLEDGRRAVVVGHNPGTPFRPRVRVFLNDAGRLSTPLDLARPDMPGIVERPTLADKRLRRAG